MKKIFYLIACFSVACSTTPTGSAQRDSSAFPVAEVHPVKLEKHGDVRVDDYFWLKERENPKVLAYLNAENAYANAVLKDTEKLQDKLFEELKGRIKQDDSTPPSQEGDYFYYRRYETGKEYPIHCRRRGEAGPEEIILDVNQLSQGQGFLSVTGLTVSPDGKTLAYAIDTVGRRIYTLRFKDLTTGKDLADEIKDVTGNMAWATDNRTIFYTKQDLTTLRSQWVYRHKLGDKSDVLVYDEKDETYRVVVYPSRSDKFIFITSDSTMSQEVRYIDAMKPEGKFIVFQPRQRGLEYEVEDGGDRFFIKTNHQARNFKLVEAPYGKTGLANWKTVVPHRTDTLLYTFAAFKNQLVLQERNKGLGRLHVIDRKTKKSVFPSFHDPVYTVNIGENQVFDPTFVRYEYESMTTPYSVYDYDFKTAKHTLKKRDEVGGGFNPDHYVSKRIFAKAKDGVSIPISLVHRKTNELGASAPLLILGYGSYGYSMDPDFSSNIISLLDRGFVFAMAHVRGGSEMGRQWYEDGRQGKKKNTFTDFIAATEALHQAGISSPRHTYALGGSAGGLLMGAIINMRPELYNGIVADVPFVDALTTMLDTSIPLTTGEFDEWGNPAQKKAYEYIKSYSPYDNVAKRAYPHMLVTTGLHDSQVQYWEPAKWVAKLRANKTDQNILIFKTEMEAGHGGKSGRFDRLKEIATRYAFLLKLENKLH